MANTAKDLDISVLLDFYGEMLTDKQRDALELYYNEDLSLAEIAEHSGITRQGVRDAIKRAENQLVECELKLGLRARFLKIKEGLEDISVLARALQAEHPGLVSSSSEFREKTGRIMEIAESLEI